jgi:DNA invertase Pin-like site-specific DNA recombinase
MTIAIYARCSSTSQTIKSQEPDLKAWSKGKEGVEWFIDKGQSGKTMNRPAFNKLLEQIRMGKVKTLVCWRLDRLGRTASGLTALFDELQRLGVNFISLKDGIDLSTPVGRLLANMLASIAEFERELRGERVAAGMEAKRQRVEAGEEVWNMGRKPGSANKATPEVCVAVKEQKAKGLKITAIAKMFGLSRPTIYAILEAP